MWSGLFLPFFIDIILDVWSTMSSWSINRELHVKSLGGLTTLESWFRLESEVYTRSFPTGTVWLTIIQTQCALHSFGLSDFLGNRVDLVSQIFFSADATWISVVDETVTLLRRMGEMVRFCSMNVARTWILIESLVVGLIRTFISIVSFPERETSLSFSIFLLHLIRAEFDVITCVNDRPLHTNVIVM